MLFYRRVFGSVSKLIVIVRLCNKLTKWTPIADPLSNSIALNNGSIAFTDLSKKTLVNPMLKSVIAERLVNRKFVAREGRHEKNMRKAFSWDEQRRTIRCNL